MDRGIHDHGLGCLSSIEFLNDTPLTGNKNAVR